MAYDLLQVAPARDVPPFKPAWLLWTILAVVLIGGGAACVIRFWPPGESINTPWFWTCVVAFPLFSWLIPFFIYLGVLQAPRRRAIDFNDARRAYLASVGRKAGIPLHVLGSGFFFSATEHENTAAALAQRRLTLIPQSRFPEDTEAVSARWIVPEGRTWLPTNELADMERHREMLPYVFDALLLQIAPEIRLLPERTGLKVRLSVATLLPTLEVEAVWRDKWQALGLRAALAEVDSTPPQLIAADLWIDGKGAARSDAANLLCVVQLNSLLNTVPDKGSAEAGVIVLFASSALTAQKQLSSTTLLFRPEQRDEKSIGQALRQAMLWGRVRGSELTEHWMTGGAETPLNRALASELDAQAVGVAKTQDLNGQHDLDFRLGSAGIAAPWLCMALAMQQAREAGQKQLISIAHAERLTLAVVAPRF
ncbi:hypothetical protein ASG35_08940 [Burkholderia sp. Leaf177]|uniref:hypothetical protein n=1 Tax=Burkholderia sp. Leaf177 TaxID=1736287 RepID=UPI0006F87106|nr:hypothetical protein [Burkholderia sp. Leaf177]KQR78537.1 hypothetical protein ASG35_08940 [Burkholderia sp. Leaf177]